MVGKGRPGPKKGDEKQNRSIKIRPTYWEIFDELKSEFGIKTNNDAMEKIIGSYKNRKLTDKELTTLVSFLSIVLKKLKANESYITASKLLVENVFAANYLSEVYASAAIFLLEKSSVLKLVVTADASEDSRNSAFSSFFAAVDLTMSICTTGAHLMGQIGKAADNGEAVQPDIIDQCRRLRDSVEFLHR